MAVLLREFEDKLDLACSPLAVQRVVFGALFAVIAPAGRLLGYRASYREYGG
jgi:hypothetical protein